TLRPSAIAPDDTTRMSRPSRCSAAMSAASETSHASRTREAAASTRSDEPTFTTMRRKAASAGALAAARGLGGLIKEGGAAGRSLRPREAAEAMTTLRMPGRCRVRVRLVRLGGGNDGEELAQGLRQTGAADRRDDERRRFRCALETRDLLLQLLGRE